MIKPIFQNMNLVLSTDAKPRLKWTAELHQQFVEAVGQLGGAEKATPKSLLRVMGIPGLTLYHLKSHLQKYRLGKSQQMEFGIDIKQEDYSEISDETRNPIKESLQMTRTIQMQMEVQRKLHEQIEVQRHLQLRIEAQGKYLQSVLKKAQEALSGYDSSSVGAEITKAELDRLVLMVSSRCESSSFSELTELGCLSPKEVEMKQVRGAVCSMESSLTSIESFGSKDDKKLENENGNSRSEDGGKKRNGSTICDGNCKEKSGKRLRKLGVLEMLDLNSQYENENENDLGTNGIDLNHKGIEQISG